MRASALLALCLLIAAPGVAATQSAAPGAASLRPGDAIRITVWRKPELSGEFRVSADSSIAEPFYQEVRVAGVPFATAAIRVREHIERFESSPRVLVEPLYGVMVGGEVRQPNLYSFGPETTIVQALMQAGGPSERGRRDRVLLFRDGSATSVDLTRPQTGTADTSIRSGDRIVVERRAALFRDVIAPTLSLMGAVAAIINVARWR